jgi:predicted alpha/beta hydrolase family esterase
MIGMDPDGVEAARAALASELAALDSVHAAISRVRLASLNPLNYAIEPGSLILAAGAIGTTSVAMALVASAKSSAEGLVGGLVAQIIQQQEASAAIDSGGILTMLGSLSAQQLIALMTDDPDLAKSLWEDPPDAAAVAAWWKGLTKSEQERLIKDAPTIIGNLNGVPYSERNTANQVALAEAEKDPNLTSEQKKALAQVKLALSQGGKGGAPRSLVDFNLAAKPPLAAVAIGNVDTADDVTVAVPGMATDVSSSMATWTTAAQNLANQQNNIDPGHTHAVIAWIGYQTPPLDVSILGGLGNDRSGAAPDSVMANHLAQRGAPRLASELDSIQDARVGEGMAAPRVAVVAHSYGTTTAAYALTETKYDVSSVDFVASAGIDSNAVPNASYLHVATANGHEQVYTSQATNDDIATIGRLGSGRADPQNGSFGSIIYSSDGAGSYVSVEGHDAIGSGPTVTLFSAGAGHGYFDLRTESLRNMAVATTGNGSLVSVPVPHPVPQPSPTPLPSARI